MDNDYELLYLAEEDIEGVVDILYKKYKNIIYFKALNYCKSNISLEDYINIGRQSLYNAVENYKDDYPFIIYLNICLDRSFSNYKKSLERNKHRLLNDAISLDNAEFEIINKMDDERFNPEKILLEESSYINLREKIIDKLTWKEELIFTLKEQNYTNKEISEITDNSLRTVYNIIKRIQNKTIKIVSS